MQYKFQRPFVVGLQVVVGFLEQKNQVLYQRLFLSLVDNQVIHHLNVVTDYQ